MGQALLNCSSASPLRFSTPGCCARTRDAGTPGPAGPDSQGTRVWQVTSVPNRATNPLGTLQVLWLTHLFLAQGSARPGEHPVPGSCTFGDTDYPHRIREISAGVKSWKSPFPALWTDLCHFTSIFTICKIGIIIMSTSAAWEFVTGANDSA